MLEFIFTLDYEIYGNGQGTLAECVINPAKEFIKLFSNYKFPAVVFPEILELKKIDEFSTDSDIGKVKLQLREIYESGHEIGLHVHSWWSNAYFASGRWQLDRREINLCILGEERISTIINEAVVSLSTFINESDFRPITFRNGYWIMQPSKDISTVLGSRDILIDSTLFKAGHLHKYGVDYRPSLRNNYYWKFTQDINKPEKDGLLIEVPIFTNLVPFWKMFTRLIKRTGENKSIDSGFENIESSRLSRIKDFLRFRYPQKLDYCFMKPSDIVSIIDLLKAEDKKQPDVYKPIVLIGHTKNLVSLNCLDIILKYLKKGGYEVTTFRQALPNLSS
jgi:hypothetical protein